MSLTTRSLRLHLLSVLGTPLAGAKVTLQLSAYQADGTDIVPLVWALPEDPAVPGDYFGPIWPNTRGDGGTHYDLLVQANGQVLLTQMVTVVAGATAAVLKAKINAAPYPAVYAAAVAVSAANTFSDSAGESASRALAAVGTVSQVVEDYGAVGAAAAFVSQAAGVVAENAGIVAVKTGEALTAKTAAEAARDSAVAASQASAITLAAKDTIALGRTAAGMVDGMTFWVKPNATDGLTRYTNYLRTSVSTQTFVMDVLPAIEFDTRISRKDSRGWVHVLRSSGGKLGLGINRYGRVIFGVGGDILARITAGESGISSNAMALAAHKALFKSGVRGSAIFRVLDSTGAKVALLVARSGKLISMGRDVLGEIDGVKTQVSELIANPVNSKYLAPSKDLTLLGDSQINGAGPTPWRTAIVPMISARNYRNLAIGGQTSTHIAGRFGAIAPLLTVAGNSIPASGPVSITACRVLKTDGTLDNGFTPITNQGSNTLYGSLAGVLGTWSRASGDGSYTFTRAVAGTAVGCPEGTPFKAIWADYDFNTLVIGLGRNNISDVPTVKRDIEACSAAQRSVEKRQIILTVTNGGSITPGVPTNEGIGTTNGNNVVALELWAEARFTGPGFEVVNVRKLLMQHGDGSADDNADIAAGTVPRSLRIDAVHYSAAAHMLIAEHIASTINTKGW